MHPSVPGPDGPEDPRWPQVEPTGTEIGADEQLTSQLPRHPDASRYPYPPPPVAPAAVPYQRPAGEPRSDGARQPRYEPPRYEPTPEQQPRYAPPPPVYRQPQYEQPQYEQPQYEQPPAGRQAPYGQPVPDDQQQTDVYVRPATPPTTPPMTPPPVSFQKAPRGSHLPPYSEPFAARGPAAGATPASGRTGGPGAGTPGAAGALGAGAAGAVPSSGSTPTDGGSKRTGPRKLTVTRVAAFRSRELTTRGVQIFQRAATADGADRSGLTALTYAVMGNYAVDAALAVALANTLFFAAATAESTSKVLLYLLITVAPFAVIAPLIGPALDKLQHGRRIALGASSFARALLAIVMALNFDSWVLYPCALGMLVLSKSFSVLKAAITPRVLPPDLSLVKSNSRLTVFGLMAGGVAGALAAGLSWAFGSTGALMLTALLSAAGGWLCLRIPSWVESTAGEIPMDGVGPKHKRAFPLSITTTLWSNGSIRVETGFLALFIAFVIKSEYADASGFTQLLLLGVVGVAAGLGGFVGNALGARLPLSKPETVSILSLAAVAVATLVAVLIPGLATAALVGLIGSTASSLAKVCLDSVIQHELPEASRASAFGLSETVLQLSWVFGGVVGLLIGGVWSFGHDSVYQIGFAVITVMLLVGLTQSWLIRSGKSLFPWLDYSRLTRHFRRSGKKSKDGSAPTTTRQAGQPPTTWTAGVPTAQTPWQPGAPPQGQAWGQAPPPNYPPYPTYQAPSYPPPPAGYPTAPPVPPGHSSGTPAQPQHTPPRDAGKPRKEL